MRGLRFAGLVVVAGCVLEPPPPPVELCNGIDDDGDPATPDGSDEPALGERCDGPDADACGAGQTGCRDGRLICELDDKPTDDAEACNGIDDDCDHEIDEGFDLEADPQHCGFCGNACANPNGTTACVAGACEPGCVAGAVDCNGNPNDGCEVFRNRNPTCQTITVMGSVAGDVGVQSVELAGTDEAIVDIAVLEQSTAKLPITATLVLDSPAGVNFDLFVSCGACGGAIMGSSTNAAGVRDQVVFRAEDNDFANDSRTLHVEIRFVSATTCSARWRLEVTGATAVAATTCGP